MTFAPGDMVRPKPGFRDGLTPKGGVVKVKPNGLGQWVFVLEEKPVRIRRCLGGELERDT